MKKTGIIVIVVLVLLVMSLMGRYNTMVGYDEDTKTAWSQVENVYQRRLDLIPNLVATVKGFAAQESKVLTDVIKARASATQTNINVKDVQAFAEYQKAQGEISSALSRLMMVTEAYPELASNKNFLELQSQIEGTENRITVERKNFNDTANIYNKYIRVFPNNLIAMIFAFERANLFEAAEGADKAPTVNFETTTTTTETTTTTVPVAN